MGHDLPTGETHIDLHFVEATAKRVFELLGDELAGRDRGPVLEDAHQTAERFALSKRWVYEHADELGVIRVGEGRRPRLRGSTPTSSGNGSPTSLASVSQQARRRQPIERRGDPPACFPWLGGEEEPRLAKSAPT